MAAVNENVPMVVDGEADEEDYIADVVVEALNEALDAGDFHAVAEMAAFENIVTSHHDIRLPQPSGSLKPPSVAPSRAYSPIASSNAEPVSIKPVAASSHVVGGLDEVANYRRAALELAARDSALHTSLVAALDLHLLSIARKGKAAASVLHAKEASPKRCAVATFLPPTTMMR